MGAGETGTTELDQKPIFIENTKCLYMVLQVWYLYRILLLVTISHCLHILQDISWVIMTKFHNMSLGHFYPREQLTLSVSPMASAQSGLRYQAALSIPFYPLISHSLEYLCLTAIKIDWAGTRVHM